MSTTYRRLPPPHTRHRATQKRLSSLTNDASYSTAATAHANTASHPHHCCGLTAADFILFSCGVV